MGTKEDVFEFNPDGSLKSVLKTDDRDLEEERAEVLDMILHMKRRCLSETDDEALDVMEVGVVADKALTDHRNAVRAAIKTAHDAAVSATTLDELDNSDWSKTIDSMVKTEFPDTLGQKDPFQPKALKTTKQPPVGPSLSPAPVPDGGR